MDVSWCFRLCYVLSTMILFLLFACTEEAQRPESVDTSSYISLWQEEPNRFVREVRALSVEEKMIIVRAILEDSSSHHSPQLCQLFEHKEKGYCEQLLLRSHIWEYDQIQNNRDKPNHPVRLVPEKPSIREKIETEISSACRPDNPWCIEEEAKQSIRGKHFSIAKGLCQSIQQPQPREECFFQLAEETIRQLSPENTSEAMRLCAYSDTYQENCYAHVIEHMADAYSELFPQYKREVLLFWDSRDDKFGRRLVDYLETSFSRKHPSSKEISFIHRNSSETYSFVQGQSKADRTLDEWRAIFQLQKKFQSITRQAEIYNYWSPLRDRGHPYCMYLSLSHRPCSSEKERDWELAMVAALAQQGFPLEKIRANQDDVIRKMLNKVRKN